MKFQVNYLLHFGSITRLTNLKAKKMKIPDPKHIEELKDQVY